MDDKNSNDILDSLNTTSENISKSQLDILKKSLDIYPMQNFEREYNSPRFKKYIDEIYKDNIKKTLSVYDEYNVMNKLLDSNKCNIETKYNEETMDYYIGINNDNFLLNISRVDHFSFFVDINLDYNKCYIPSPSSYSAGLLYNSYNNFSYNEEYLSKLNIKYDEISNNVLTKLFNKLNVQYKKDETFLYYTREMTSVKISTTNRFIINQMINPELVQLLEFTLPRLLYDSLIQII